MWWCIKMNDEVKKALNLVGAYGQFSPGQDGYKALSALKYHLQALDKDWWDLTQSNSEYAKGVLCHAWEKLSNEDKLELRSKLKFPMAGSGVEVKPLRGGVEITAKPEHSEVGVSSHIFNTDRENLKRDYVAGNYRYFTKPTYLFISKICKFTELLYDNWWTLTAQNKTIRLDENVVNKDAFEELQSEEILTLIADENNFWTPVIHTVQEINDKIRKNIQSNHESGCLYYSPIPFDQLYKVEKYYAKE